MIFYYALISVKPIAVTIMVEGTPNLRWAQNVRLYLHWARRACSHTIRLAADPSSDRFPATVLTQANMSHAFFSFSGDIVAAAAATLDPSNSTENKKIVRIRYTPRHHSPLTLWHIQTVIVWGFIWVIWVRPYGT